MKKILTADFSKGNEKAYVRGLYQHDYGAILKVTGIEYAEIIRVDFAGPNDEKAHPVVALQESDGGFCVKIPKENTDKAGELSAYIYVTDAEAGFTIKEVILPIIGRVEADPDPSGEKTDPFAEAIEEIKKNAKSASDSAASAAESEKSASKSATQAEKSAVQSWKAVEAAAISEKAAATSATAAAESASQSRESAAIASSAADQAAKSATAAAESATTAAQLAENATRSATNASGSAESASQSAETAKTAADAASKSGSAAQQAAGSASESASTATAAAQTATTAAGKAAGSATSASQSAENAGQKATAAETAAGSAAESETEAAKSATAAGDSASAAKTSETAAEEAAQTAQEQAEKIKASAEQIEKNKTDVTSLKEDLTNNIDTIYSGTENLKSAIEWFYGAYFEGYFHDNTPGNELVSKPFTPNNLLKLVVQKISDNVDYQIEVCESTFNENGKIVYIESTSTVVLNSTASVEERKIYEFTAGKTYSVRIKKAFNSSVIVTDKTALNYFSINLVGNSINENAENFAEHENRLKTLEGKTTNLLPDCSNKKIVLFGDSLFACSNEGDAWGGVLQKHFGFGTYIGVGIGGSKFIANGKATLPTDFSVGNSLPKTLVVSSDGTTPCAFSDWARIDATIPNDVDIIIVGTSVNDSQYGEYWIKEDSPDITGFAVDGSIETIPHVGWDIAWQNSAEYANYNGDWDRSFLGGAIRSTIMKLQAKAPNAKIFVTNWCNSRGTTGQIGTNTLDITNTENVLSILKKVCNDFGVEIIDLFSDSGINPLNRLQYVKDSIHLTDDGYTKMMAQPIVSAVRNYIMSAYN